MFLKLLLNGLLYILVMAMIASTDENARVKLRSAIDIRSSNCLVPFHYNLNITLEPKYLSSGEVNATIFINCATHNIILPISKNIIIMKVKLKSANSGISYTPKQSFYARKEEYVVLNFVDQFLPENNLECGVYTLYVEFLHLLSEYISRELLQTWYMVANEKEHKKLIITTQIQPRRARQLFPCWDEPELSATFNISIKHKINNKVLSNAPIREYESIDDNWMRTLFHTTPHMSTNDIAIIMYDVDELYQVFNSTVFDPRNIVVNTWCRSHLIPHMKFAQYVAGNVTMYLDNNWKMLKNVPKVDYVAIPNFEDKIWQTWGLVFYKESDIIYNEELHFAAFKITVMRSIAHDITYQWFGDLFSPSHWWLNEGFIMFLETYIIDQAFLGSRMMDLFVVQVQHESRHLNTNFAINDTMEYTSNIPKINSPFPFSQIKGGFVWRMLKSIISNHVFWFYIKTYLNLKFTYSNSNTPDHLWNIMQPVIDVNFKECDLNVKQMMDIWTVEEHCPVINVTRDYSSGRVKISKDFHDKLDQKSYFIPVTYTEETNINFDIRFSNIHCLTQSNPQLEVQLRYNDSWIIVNLQQIGCYRVNYHPGNWQRIARYLNSENYTNIHVLNRAQIIDDAFHLAIEKKLNFSIFWKLARYLSREKDYVAWYPMIKAFEYISNIFAFSNTDQHVKKVLVKIESLFKHIEKHVYNQTMVHTKDDLSKCLQQELAKWGCIIDNSFCKEMASNQLQLYLENPEKNKILPGWQKWTYCNGLKAAKYDTWQLWSIAFTRIYKEKSDYKVLEFLSCFEDPEIINYYPQFVMAFENDLFEDNENKSSAQEKKRFYALTANIFLSILARHAKNTIILTKILNNFESIKDSRVSMNAALSVMINNAYSKEQLDEILEFAKNNAQQSYINVESKLITRLSELCNQLKYLYNLFDESNTTINICKITYSTISRPTTTRPTTTRPTTTRPTTTRPTTTRPTTTRPSTTRPTSETTKTPEQRKVQPPLIKQPLSIKRPKLNIKPL